MKALNPAKLMTGDAVFDRSGKYRYSLSRTWNSGRPKAAFVMLNPSKADAERNDPTISRCISFAENLGCGSLEVVNLFAYRTAYPHQLKACRYPVGKLNDQYISEAISSASLVIVAWGNWGSLHGRDRQVLSLLSSHNKLLCFGLTLRGQPRHPLFLPAQSELVIWPV